MHCSSCNINYEADFDKSVELTFTPNPTIRQILGGIYCASGPGNTPHIHLQIRLQPNENKEVVYRLLPGIYKIYSLQTKAIVDLKIDSSGENSENISFDGIKFEQLHLTPGNKNFSLQIQINEIVVKLEHAIWLENIVTASEVTAMHEFRNYFLPKFCVREKKLE